jgi:hypothetical protein
MKCCGYCPSWHIENTSSSLKLTNGTKSWSVTIHLAKSHAGNKHSNLLSPFVSYEENKVLWIRPQVTMSRNLLCSQLTFWTISSKNLAMSCICEQKWYLYNPPELAPDITHKHWTRQKGTKILVLFVLSSGDKEKNCVTIKAGVCVLNAFSFVSDLTYK